MLVSPQMKPRTYTTYEAAKKIGVSRQTLYTWIGRGDIVAPEVIHAGKISIRLWTLAEIEQAKRFKGKLKPGPRSKKKKK
jgi:excisionase family DNA binding protein